MTISKFYLQRKWNREIDELLIFKNSPKWLKNAEITQIERVATLQ